MEDGQKKIQCVGFIMDGNRRWAKAKGLPALEGHRKGSEAFIDMVRSIRDAQIPHAIFYAFSTENWNRTQEEISGLFTLFAEGIEKLITTFAYEEMVEQKVRFRFIGETHRFSENAQERMKELELLNADATTTIWVALSYGGRSEIIAAVKKLAETDDTISEEKFAQHLMTAGMPDPDIVVRTGGAQRLSNFLPWQSVYSELLFLDTLWPDMTKESLDDVLRIYRERKRNFGT